MITNNLLAFPIDSFEGAKLIGRTQDRADHRGGAVIDGVRPDLTADQEPQRADHAVLREDGLHQHADGADGPPEAAA